MHIVREIRTFAAHRSFHFMRRIIRIKAMQALYSYYQNQAVNLEEVRRRVSAGLIEIPAFYNAGPEEKAGFKALLPLLLDDAFAGKHEDQDLLENQKWLLHLTQDALTDWHRENENQKKRIIEGIRSDITRQTEKEVFFWNLFRSLIQQVENEEENRRQAFLKTKPGPAHQLKILQHPFLPLLDPVLNPSKGKMPNSFLPLNPEWSLRLYPILFKELPEYIAYRDAVAISPEDEVSVWKVLYRKLLRSDVFNEIMEEADLHWSENRILLEVALKETHQLLTEGRQPVFARNPEEEEEMSSFFSELFESCLQNVVQDEEKLSKVVTNWDPERVSPIDKFIILLSINEMRRFPHIPVKVTINEYLEIAKAYSGPGAASFINGVTDRMAKMYQKEGLIKKSAKGMMDNR